MKRKVVPVKPREILGGRADNIPDEVLKIFNTLIKKKFDGRQAIVRQEDVLKALVTEERPSHAIFENHWLDVEPIYRKAGWKVEYDKPGYNEDYDAFWVFKR